jgi:RimJ/RimL family protein N-acetyltransferase
MRRNDRLYLPQSREAAKRWAQETSVREPADDAFHFEVENLAGELVGAIGTHDCHRRNGTFGYGVAVRAEHQRRGYASAAIRMVLRYFFEELRYQKATITVYSFNEPSIRLHESLGFQPEGRIRRMGFTEGGFFDHLIFGMTAEEFAAQATGGSAP